MASAAPSPRSTNSGTPAATGPKSAKPRRRIGLPAKVGLLCGSLLFCCLLAEIALRVAGVRPQTATVLSTFFQYDAETGWRGKPEAASRFATTNFDVSVSHDSEGFRRGGYEAPLSSDASSPNRITWVLGDSGTWGWGVDDGKTYVDGLNQLSRDGTRYRNLGHCGFSSVQQYLLVKDLFAKGYKPKEVVVLFCGNDLNENLDDRDQSPARAYLKVVGDEATLMNHPTPKSGGWGMGTWLKNHSLVWNHAHYYATRAKLRWKEKKAADARPATAALGGTANEVARIPDITVGWSILPPRAQAGSFADMKASPERAALIEELSTKAAATTIVTKVDKKRSSGTADLAPPMNSDVSATNVPATSIKKTGGLRSTEAKPALNCPPDQIVGLKHAYRLLRDLCREQGVRLYIVNDGPAVVPTVCDELGITWFDMSARWREYQNSPDKDRSPYFPTDPHFNEFGHRLIAEALDAQLTRLRGEAGTVLVGKPSAQAR